MSVPYLSDLERGRWNPSLAMLVDLGRALELHPSELLKGLTVDLTAEPPKRRRSED
jgi:transcriptional regulator with XRE-family HTH domain